ncbi:hypothetical protein K1T71_003035 [Dendrolimus kikuchii]|uniref:Uncharacterized protein n=1 Tax=Dendrolimus kikuchii TaxID=765133 RepID=A0ACC1DAT1_9NEOP|nr:hypothetical protein K1T71_003035 [Dendrolimus kikuchii]
MRNKTRKTDSAIKAGELILTEQPFVFVLSSKEQGNRCDNCLEKVKVLKCSGCQFVHYCGRVCQRDAWGDHKWECANLKRIAPKVIPDGARIMAKIINRLNRGDGHTLRSFYSATSFRMWKDLMSRNYFCVILLLVVFFFNLLRKRPLSMTISVMAINSFMILDIDMNSIGTGIYLASSIVDHSCNPNAVVTFDGKTISIRAIRDMTCLDWNQIRISYIDLMKTPYERQTELLNNYYFLCQCDRCMDENQIKYAHAAKCLNDNCDNPINIPWKANCQLVRKLENGKVNNTLQDGSSHEQNGVDEIQNGGHANNEEINNKNGFNIGESTLDVVKCKECGTKFDEKHIETFVKAMEVTHGHLQSMSGASVAYVDVCKYCLEKQEGVLHPLNVMHAQTLDHAFDALIQVQLWEKACVYAEKLIPCFRFYYGDRNPLLGLLYLKYAKILLYKMDLNKALTHLKQAEKILKMTHGEKHPLYREQLVPLIQQAMIESN